MFIDIGHPAHVHYYKNFISIMKKKGNEFFVTTRDKDMTLELLNYYNIPHIVTGKNKKSLPGKVISLLRNDWKVFNAARNFKPDIFLSSFLPFPAHIGYLLNIPVVGFTDTEHATLNHLLTKKFTDTILTPSCYTGSFSSKHIRFNGYMELCYLHPNYFKPDTEIYGSLGVKKHNKCIIIRFVSWQASHDIGQDGLGIEVKRKIVKELSLFAKVLISSEKELPKDLKPFQLNISPNKIHDVLAFASLYIGEGATMASECAMLGTPAIYVNNLDVGYCTEEEKKYGLAYNYRNSNGVISKAKELFNYPNLKEEFQRRRNKMLSDKIDVTAFMVWFIENYPKSVEVMKKDPDYQYNFK